MRISAAKIKLLTISECEDLLEDIALRVVSIEDKIHSVGGEEQQAAIKYLERLKTIRYAVNTRYGRLNRKAGDKLRLKNLILDELRQLVGHKVYAECKQRAEQKMTNEHKYHD